MATIRIPVQTAPIPENYCFKGFNSPSWPQLIGYEFVELPESYPQVVSQSVPAAEYRGTHTWLRLDSKDRPYRLYFWHEGQWVSRHPEPPGTIKMVFFANENDIATYDEGDTYDFKSGVDATTTDRFGPMWAPITRGTSGQTKFEFASPYGARMPIHPGVLNNSDGTVTTINSQTLSGESQTILTIPNLPPHNHGIPDGYTVKINVPSSDKGLTTTAPATAIGDILWSKDIGDGDSRYPDEAIDMTSKSHNNMPPVFGIWFIRKTNRIFYRDDYTIPGSP